jgi:formate-dependent phosphoribosylglycinamide formyltransferase (GAR transformylase)
MKEALREAGIPTAASVGADSPDDAWNFVREVGYPVVVKPRAAAGASGTHRVDDDQALDRVIRETGLDRGAPVAVEEFVEGHEGFWDTVTIRGEVAHEFVTHYYPNVLEAMRTRWISPQFIATNRVDSAPDYQEVKELGRRVIAALGIHTSATHMEWFFGPKGLRFSEIGCRPPGVGAWDLYCAGNEMDLYKDWAMAVCWGRTEQTPSRRYSAGHVALRPEGDGEVSGYEGVDTVLGRFGEHVIAQHFPPPGTPTQPVEAGYMANAWLRMRHTDYDHLRGMLNQAGETIRVRTG